MEIIKDIILDKITDMRLIILFGSYARDEWVEDAHIEENAVHIYESDFDILVVTDSQKRAIDTKLHYDIKDAIDETKKVKTTYCIIYHDFDYVQQMINEGHYFFVDIKIESFI